jgi:hypothetical protein
MMDTGLMIMIGAFALGVMAIIGDRRGWFGKREPTASRAGEERRDAAGVDQGRPFTTSAFDLPGTADNKVREWIRAQLDAGKWDDIIGERAEKLYAQGKSLGGKMQEEFAEQEAKLQAALAALRAKYGKVPAAQMVRAPGPANPAPGNYHMTVDVAAPTTDPVRTDTETLEQWAERHGMMDRIAELRTVAAIHPGLGFDLVGAMVVDPVNNRAPVLTGGDLSTLQAANGSGGQ